MHIYICVSKNKMLFGKCYGSIFCKQNCAREEVYRNRNTEILKRITFRLEPSGSDHVRNIQEHKVSGHHWN